MKTLLTAASIAAFAAAAAMASERAPAMHGGHGADAPRTRADVEKMVAERFGAADANKDGTVTTEEFNAHVEQHIATAKAKMAEMHGRMFDKLDTDKNGQISKQEWEAHHDGMRTKFEERRETAGAGDGKQHREKHVMVMHGGHGDAMPMMKMMHRSFDRMGEHWFKKHDTNSDGKVTLDEAKAKALAHFDAMDANRDGTLTPEERRAGHKKMREEWKAKRG